MTSGVTERDRAKADRQAAILHEAARLFAERGFSGVSLEDLGAAVGVSGPAVYRHFANKQALLGAILVERERAAARRRTRGGRARERLADERDCAALIALPRRLRPRRRRRHPRAGSRPREPARRGPAHGAPAAARVRRAVDRRARRAPSRRARSPTSACARTRASASSTRRRTACAAARLSRRQHGARHPRIDGLAALTH